MLLVKMRRENVLPIICYLVLAFMTRYSEQSSFEDERCVCVCPGHLGANGTGPVYIKMVEPNLCQCENVVPPSDFKGLDICHFCECRYESRNTTTIKVVVIFIICVVSLLFIYMLFLLCLDPLIQHQPAASYSVHKDEEVKLEDMSARPSPSQVDDFSAEAARQRSILNRVTDEQKRWKGTVKEQRRNIYDHHSMLN